MRKLSGSLGRVDLEWLARVLWDLSPEEVGHRTHVRSEVDAVYAVVPGFERPRFVVPLASKTAAAASLLQYNALRPAGTRGLRWLVGNGFRFGVSQLLLRDRLVVPASRGGRGSLADHVAELLGAGGDDLTMAVGIGGRDPSRKPVIQVLSRGGTPIAYVKIGWNSATRQLVRNEIEALRRIEAADLRSIRAPGLLHHDVWREAEICVTSPLPLKVRAHHPIDRVPPMRATLEVRSLGDQTFGPLARSAFWRRTAARAEAAARTDDPIGKLVSETLSEIAERCGAWEMEFGGWHGDWSPWNLAWYQGELYVLDWEYFGETAPVGFDLLGYLFQVSWSGRHQPFVQAARRMRAGGIPLMRELGLEPARAQVVADLYLVELALRANELWAGSGIVAEIQPMLVEELRRISRSRGPSRADASASD